MLVSEKLKQFYLQNNLTEDGGENDDYFYLKFRFFSLKLPNSDFRKKAVYIHDIQHVLYNQDTTWKGEAFIAGWEIATGFWKLFPIGFLSLWAMGFSTLIYPKEVLQGYKEGLKVNGIINLNIPKKHILNYTIEELFLKMMKTKPINFNWFIYIIWIFISLTIVLSPILFLLAIYFFI